MTSWKRRIANLVESTLDVRIARANKLSLAIEQEFLSRFLEHFEVDLVLDVGANEGQYARMLRDRAGYSGAIVSFEPIPEVAARLRQASQGDALWIVEEVALSDSEGRSTFNVMSDSQFSSLLEPAPSARSDIDGMNSVSTQIDVSVRRVETYLTRYRDYFGAKRIFLKMDTQGHDLNVVVGAGDALSLLVGIQTELAFTTLYDHAPRFDEMLTYLESRGFALSSIFPNNAGHFPDLLEMDCVLYRRPEFEPC